MRLKCIKDKGAHWGEFFKEGEWYDVSKIYSRRADVITHFDNWSDYIREFLEAVAPFRALKNESDKASIQEVNEAYKINPYTKEVIIELCEVIGMDKKKHIFCLESKKDVEEKYGTCKFETTIEFIEDTFINVDYIRNDIIDSIIN